MTTPVRPSSDLYKAALNRRLEQIGWGLFLILIGGLWVTPAEHFPPRGAWLIGAALILLGLNVARRLKGIATSHFTVLLGVLALAAGVGGALNVDLPLFPLLLLAGGAAILLKAVFDRKG